MMSSQDGHPSNPRPLKRRRIADDRLPTTSSQGRHSPRVSQAENNIYNDDEGSDASENIRRTTTPSRFDRSPANRRNNDIFLRGSQVSDRPIEEDDVVQTSDIEELLITEEHEPQAQRSLLRTSSFSRSHPAYTSPPPTSTASKSRSPAASVSSDIERGGFEPAILSTGTPKSPASQPALTHQPEPGSQRKDIPIPSSSQTSPTDQPRASQPRDREEIAELSSPDRVEGSTSFSRPLSRSPSSSGLSSAPPSPPRRRTRESNKFFKPYTIYRQQYGNVELDRLDRLDKEKEKHHEHHRTVDDEIWVASQTQVEEESQIDVINFLPSARSRISHHPKGHRPPSTKALPPPTSARPAKHHEQDRRKPSELSRETHTGKYHRRDPRAAPFDGPLIDNRLASKEAIDKALQKLYEEDDESEDDGDLFAAPTIVKSSVKLPELATSTDDEDLSQPPLYRPRNHMLITEDDEDENCDEQNRRQLPEESQENSQDESEQEESDYDSVDAKKQRILARIWPQVMIRKEAEAAKAKELERQRKLRDEERARRARLGLSDSDMSDVQDDGKVVPGESRTRRLGSIPAEPVQPLETEVGGLSDEEQDYGEVHRVHASRKEVIDISSDQESLDNDIAEENLVASSSASDGASSSSELEAVEDNTVHGYGRGNTKTRISGRRSYARVRNGSSWNERRPVMRQTRIDRMLNSTRHKSSRSRRTIKDNDAHQQREHQRSRNNAPIRLPPNTHMVAPNSHTSHQIQTKLPFRPVQDEVSDKNQHTTSASKHRKENNGRKKGSSSNYRRDRQNSRQSRSRRVPKELLPSVFDVMAPGNRNQYASNTSADQSNQSRPVKSKPHPSKFSSHIPVHTPYRPSHTTGIEDPYDPDAKIDISLRTALAFGARRSRAGFSFPSSSWISQGRLLDLIYVLCQRSEPSEPLPCRVSTLHLTAQTSVPDLQVQFPTICDLIFDMISQKATPSQELFTSGQNLMRFVCVYVSWIGKNEVEEAKDMLRLVRTQIDALMERVEEWIKVRSRTGREFDHGLFAIHWFAVEISSRITAALSRPSAGQDEVVILNDPDTDRYIIRLMSRLLEYGPRRAGQAFQNKEADVLGGSSVSEYALQLWVAIIHIVTLIPETEDEFSEASTTFWNLLVGALDQSSRPFASAVHNSEFIFATVFTISSISSIDALGFGQEQRRLRAYWRIVDRALTCVNLVPDSNQKLPQNVVAARDTYIGMLFARCNVLAFRWDWSLQEPQHSINLLHALRDALKNRKFMNLVHEQSDFPSFIIKQDLNLLHEFDPKDSVQTILIKLMVRKAETSPQGLPSAKKWIGLLASTTKLEFSKDIPPTQKELSALFNQFTIKLVLLYISPNPSNVRVLVNNSKDVIDFKLADLRSRQVCIRAAMIFGRFCQHFELPPEEPVMWLAEMGAMVLDEATSIGLNATSRQTKETGLLCALIVASVRDILGTRARDEEEPTAFPTLPDSLISFLLRLLSPTKRYSSCLPEIALLLRVVFDLRSAFIPPPRVPQLPAVVVEEESQGDYGFEPIDANDPSLIQAFAAETNQNDGLDTVLTNTISRLTNSIALLIPWLSHAEAADKEEAYAELWVDCWARIGAISVTHRLKDWGYFLQRSPATIGRLDDLDWFQQMEPMFCLRILSEDPKTYEPHKENFLKVFFAALIARDSDLRPSYIWTLIRVDGMKHRFLENIPFRRDATEQEFEDEYHDSRLELVQAILRNADRAYQEAMLGTEQALKLRVEAVENVACMLKNLRYNMLSQKTQQSERIYERFSLDVISFLRNLNIHSETKISQALDGLGVIDLTRDERGY